MGRNKTSVLTVEDENINKSKERKPESTPLFLNITSNRMALRKYLLGRNGERLSYFLR